MTEQKSSPEKYSQHSLREQLTDALAKDSGPLGDVTSQALVEKETKATAEMIVKGETGIVSGIDVARLVFEIVDQKIHFTPLLRDGEAVKRGDRIATITGPARSILVGERIALEYIRRLSGIATKTSLFVKEIEDTKTKILDTRKILPGYGQLDKQAVRDGGGENHRSNLSEMGLIKNNHIDILGGDVALAIGLFRDTYPDIPLEVEVRNEAEFITALTSGPDRILLDNMNLIQTKEAVQARNLFSQKVGVYIPLEASGDMTLDRIRAVAETGVDYISVGALTHSVEAFDISLHISFNK